MADERLIFGLAERHYRAMAEVFQRYPEVEKVLIFGSRAKDTERNGSDFDLAVFGPDLSEQAFSQLWNEIDDLPLIFKVDLLHWDNLPQTPIKEKILAEGKLFFPLD